MWILVDYDNLDSVDKNRGVEHCVFSILQAIGPDLFEHNEGVALRLYGGWYEGDNLSKLAQDITKEIATVFPKPMVVQSGTSSKVLRVNAQLARSLLVDPSRDLLHTFRRRAYPRLECAAPPFDGCVRPDDCPVAPVHRFLHDRCCPCENCSVHPKRAISRPEQKLVDTMITADLVELALRPDRVAVVSSDDDMWPGIRLSVSRGTPVLHIHTRRGQSTPELYTQNLGSSYTQLRMGA